MNIIIYDRNSTRSDQICSDILSVGELSSIHIDIIECTDIDSTTLDNINELTNMIFIHANNPGADIAFEASCKRNITTVVYTGGVVKEDWFKKTKQSIYLTSIDENGFSVSSLNKFFAYWTEPLQYREKDSQPLSLLLQTSSPNNLMALAILCQGYLADKTRLSYIDWACLDKYQLKYELEDKAYSQPNQKNIILDFVDNLAQDSFNLGDQLVNDTLSVLKNVLES